MRTTSLALLALVTIVAAGGALRLPDDGGPMAPPPPPKPEPVLPGLGDWANGAGDLAIRTSTATVSLTRKPNAPWTVTQKDGYPADAAKVTALVKQLGVLRKIEPKTADPKLYRRLDVGGPDATDHGTDPQSTLVTLKDGQNHTAEIILGKAHSDAISGSEDGVYIRLPSEKASWLADPTANASAQPLDWIDPAIVDVDPASVTSIALKPANVTFTHPSVAGATTPWHADGLPGGSKLKAADPTTDLTSAFHPLHLTDVEKSDRITGNADGEVVLQTKDGVTLDLQIFKRGNAWVRLHASGTGDAAKKADAINAKSGAWAYKIDDDTAKTLTQSAADFIQPPPAPPGAAPAPGASPAPGEPAPAP